MNEQNQQVEQSPPEVSGSASPSGEQAETNIASKQERRQLKNERKHQEKLKLQRQQKMNKFLRRVVWLVVIVGILAGLGFLISNQKVLPGTSSQGHIEKSPESHIVTSPMDTRIHAHMLEHADGSGPPGIIINYNCEQFECEPDLLDDLAKIVEEYPENVYLAPYGNMSAKLVLSAEGRQDVLDDFDEQRIRKFISGKVSDSPSTTPLTDEVSGFRVGQNVIYVADQKPDAQLTVNLVTLAENGYVVIHEEIEGSPGEIIGNTLLLEQGDHSNTKAILKRASLEGETLIAMLHKDNGDGEFVPAEDQPIKDADGNVTFMVFSISSAATEPAAVSL